METLPKFLGCLIMIACCISCRSQSAPVPPPMPKRPIAPSSRPEPGETVMIREGADSFTLFVPTSWMPSASENITLVMNFHGTPWFVIQEHLRRGMRDPLVAVALGEGSTVYRKGFEDPQRLARLIAVVEGELKTRGAPRTAHVTTLEFSSFSAGYGAVREIVKQDRYVKIIRRIVLCDSMYGSWDPATTKPGATSKPAAENIDPWVPYAKMAARGEKEFVLTHSRVPTSYANTEACAMALIEAVGAKRIDVPRGSLAATTDPDYPLVYRADVNGFHVWGYGGIDAGAHMTHPRHLAEVWMALDKADR